MSGSGCVWLSRLVSPAQLRLGGASFLGPYPRSGTTIHSTVSSGLNFDTAVRTTNGLLTAAPRWKSVAAAGTKRISEKTENAPERHTER